VSLLTGADGAPLSKRHGATTLHELRDAGYGPGAINNLLYRLGHSSAEQRLLTLSQMAAGLDVAHLQRASAHFDLAQLRHWQREWLHSLPPEAARDWIRRWLPAPLAAVELERFCAAVLPNVLLADEVREWQQILHGDALAIEGAAREQIGRAGPAFFAAAAAAARDRDPDLATLRAATGMKGAAFFMPLRAALTGRLHGPEFAPLLLALGTERVRVRLQAQAQPATTPNAGAPS
jgi:glutamyl-tRNA synthetase